MITCKDCKVAMYPENPEQPFFGGLGKQLPPLCYSCPGYQTEPLPEPARATTEPSYTQTRLDHQQGMIMALTNKLNEQIELARRKKPKYKTYD